MILELTPNTVTFSSFLRLLEKAVFDGTFTAVELLSGLVVSVVSDIDNVIEVLLVLLWVHLSMVFFTDGFDKALDDVLFGPQSNHNPPQGEKKPQNTNI